jgi:hypothetical protein
MYLPVWLRHLVQFGPVRSHLSGDGCLYSSFHPTIHSTITAILDILMYCDPFIQMYFVANGYISGQVGSKYHIYVLAMRSWIVILRHFEFVHSSPKSGRREGSMDQIHMPSHLPLTSQNPPACMQMYYIIPK